MDFDDNSALPDDNNVFPIDDNLLHDDTERVDGNMHLDEDIDDDNDNNQFIEILFDIEENYNDVEFSKFRDTFVSWM